MMPDNSRSRSVALFAALLVWLAFLAAYCRTPQLTTHRLDASIRSPLPHSIVYVALISSSAHQCAHRLNSILVDHDDDEGGHLQTTAATSNDLVIFNQLVRAHDDLAISVKLEGTAEVGNTAAYHAMLSHERVLELARDWLFGGGGHRDNGGCNNNNSNTTTTILPLSPVPLAWSVQDLVFGIMVATAAPPMRARYVLIGDTASIPTLKQQYADFWHSTCTAESSSLWMQCSRGAPPPLENIADFIDCDDDWRHHESTAAAAFRIKRRLISGAFP